MSLDPGGCPKFSKPAPKDHLGSHWGILNFRSRCFHYPLDCLASKQKHPWHKGFLNA